MGFFINGGDATINPHFDICSKEITKRYQPMLDKLNLTYTQYVVMMFFWEVGGGSAGDVSRALLLDPSTLTPILRTLEKKGFLARERDPMDERRVRITLTEAGERLKDDALAVPAKMADCLGLTEAESMALGELIGKILNNLEKEQ